MRTTKTLSVSIPPSQLKDKQQMAKKENRTMSELVRELYRRYVADEGRRDFARTLEQLRAETAKTPAGKLSMRQIDAEITAARRDRRMPKSSSKRPPLKSDKNTKLLAALRAVQQDARRTGLDKVTASEINAEIAASRRPRANKPAAK